MDPEIRRLRSAWQLSRSPTGTLLKMELVRSLPDAVGVSADEVSTPTPDRVFETVGCQKPTALGTSYFREYWASLSARPAAGRPRVSPQIMALVVRMAQANPLWGAPRIHGELQMLGIDVAERPVSRLLPQRRSPPSQTWRTFLTNHVRDLVSVDFFTVPTARLRVLFVFVVLAHDRRRVLHFNVTGHPTAAWTTQQIVEAFPDDSAPSYLLRDRDSVYGHVFRQRLKGMAVGEVLTAPTAHGRTPSRSGSSAPSGASV